MRETETRRLSTDDIAGVDDADRQLGRDPSPGEPEAVERLEPLLPADDVETLRARWHELQASFVDEPQRVVEHADELVADLMQRLATTFADERRTLEEQWSRGDDVSTEDLRVALTRYRSFFERLLAT